MIGWLRDENDGSETIYGFKAREAQAMTHDSGLQARRPLAIICARLAQLIVPDPAKFAYG